jgi:hypothetical protein
MDDLVEGMARRDAALGRAEILEAEFLSLMGSISHTVGAIRQLRTRTTKSLREKRRRMAEM